jgi:hypothetical protein
MNDPKVIVADPLELMLACVVCFSVIWLIFSLAKSLTVRRFLCFPLALVAKPLTRGMVDSSDGLIQMTGWVCLAFLMVVAMRWVIIPMVKIDNERRRAVGLKWYQLDRDHKVDAYIKTGRIPQSNAPDVGLKSQAPSNAPDVGITRYYSPDVSHDNERLPSAATDVLFALHTLGGTRLVWDAYPVGDGPLEIGSLHLEDTTGKPVRFGWAARRCEDDAYELANRYSGVPGHYVLALPAGTLISAPSMT